MQHEEMVKKVIALHYGQPPKDVHRITLGIINEVYNVNLGKQDVIVRLNENAKYLKGSHEHIPQLRALGIPVPEILFEDYSKTTIPLAYQIQNKIEGNDLGYVIETMSDEQLKNLAKQIVNIIQKVSTIPASKVFGIIWGGGDNDTSKSWTERMKIWINESKEHGTKSGVMDKELIHIADEVFTKYKTYFDIVSPVTYCGDISSKNVMIKNGEFNGLVDLDGLTQGDPLECIGRIHLSWYGTHHGTIYTNAIMDELKLNKGERHLVTMYALLNAISRACENKTANTDQLKHDKAVIKKLFSDCG